MINLQTPYGKNLQPMLVIVVGVVICLSRAYALRVVVSGLQIVDFTPSDRLIDPFVAG